MRDDVARSIADMGATLSPQLVAASQNLYAASHETEPYGVIAVERDVAYGVHPRQRLDVFHPRDGGRHGPSCCSPTAAASSRAISAFRAGRITITSACGPHATIASASR